MESITNYCALMIESKSVTSATQVIQNCPIQDKLTNTSDKLPCNAAELKVSDSERVVTVNMNDFASIRKDKKLLEVVAGTSKNAKKLNAVLSGTKGPCGNHKSNIIVGNSLGKEIAKASNTLSNFVVTSKVEANILEKIWPYILTPVRYDVKSLTCGNILSAKVDVYSDIEWSIELSLKYDKNTGKFKYDGTEITYEQDGKKVKVEIDKGIKWLKVTIEFIERCIEAKATFDRFYADLTGQNNAEEYGLKTEYPNIQISGKWGWKESSITTLNYYPIEFEIALTPLIGFTYRKDVLGWILSIWPLFKQAYDFIKPKIDKNIEFKLDFEVSGKIAKSLGLRFNLEKSSPGMKDKNIIGSPGQAYSLDFKLTGAANINIYYVAFGAAIEGKTGFKFTLFEVGADDIGAFIKIPFEFTGLTVKYMVYKGEVVKISSESAGRGNFKKGGASIEGDLIKLGKKEMLKEPLYIK